MDINLPGMDGYEALEVLQSDLATANHLVERRRVHAVLLGMRRHPLFKGFARLGRLHDR